MSDDIVARLREFNEERLNYEPLACERTAKEAADKIERLTAERDALRALMKNARPYVYGKTISDRELGEEIDAALKGTTS